MLSGAIVIAVVGVAVAVVRSQGRRQEREQPEVGIELGLAPDAPHWARWASGPVRLHFMPGWKAFAGSVRPEEMRRQGPLPPSTRSRSTRPSTGSIAAPLPFNLDTSIAPQCETSIVEDPTGPGRIVGAYNDLRGYLSGGSIYHSDLTGWSISVDSAMSVDKDGQAQPEPGEGLMLPPEGDPVLAADSQGNFFLASLNFTCCWSGVVVYRSPNAASGLGLFSPSCRGGDGDTNCWPTTALVVSDPTDQVGRFFYDKEWLAVDRSESAASGMVYVTWTSFQVVNAGTVSPSAIQIAKCTNSLSTCTNPVTLDHSDGQHSPLDFLQFSYVIVGSDGRPRVVWVRHDGRNPDSEVAVIKYTSIKPTDDPNSVGAVGPVRVVARERYPIPVDTAPFPAIHPEATVPVLAQTGSNLVVVWARRTPRSLTFADSWFASSDIVAAISRDDGRSWSRPGLVSGTAPNAKYQPAVCVSRSGEVEVAYYSSERDPAGHHQDIFLATSTDNGTSWNSPIRVTDELNDEEDVPWAPPANFIGDYIGASCEGSNTYIHYTANYVAKEAGFDSIKLKQQDTFVSVLANP